MKKKLLVGLLAIVICFTLVGCGNKEVTITELRDIQEKITDAIVSYNQKNNDEYGNFASVAVDEKEMMVIVELVDNSKEQQTWFKNNIFDSKYIKFMQGGPYTTSASEENLNKVNNKIIEYFSSDNVKYNNLSFNYIDMTNKVVVVGLLVNSKEYRDSFKKIVVDSDLIVFVQGENLIDHRK